jgi:hypothetical protein
MPGIREDHKWRKASLSVCTAGGEVGYAFPPVLGFRRDWLRDICRSATTVYNSASSADGLSWLCRDGEGKGWWVGVLYRLPPAQ